MKKTKKLAPFKYYYKELVSHHGVTPQNKKAVKKFILLTSIMDIILLILCFLLIVYRYSKIVKERIEGGANEKAVLRFSLTALSFASISIFPG